MIQHLVIRSDTPQYVERFGSGIGELERGIPALKAKAPQHSLSFDLLYTQYGDLLVSQGAAEALSEAGLTGFICDPRVSLFAGKVEMQQRYLALLPRGFAGLVHPSSGVRITRFSKGQFAFVLPADPRWESDPGLYAAAGDLLIIWPFYDQVFVSDRFRAVVEARKLNGFGFMPFDAKEPKERSGWRSAFHRRMNLGPPPAWLSAPQKLALWRQMLVCAEPGVLPGEPPADWGADGPLEASSDAPRSKSARGRAAGPSVQWGRRRLLPPLAPEIKRNALDYLREEVATPDAHEWSPRSLEWDGDAQVDGKLLRRWRLNEHPEPIWVVYEVDDGGQVSYSMFEESPGGPQAH